MNGIGIFQETGKIKVVFKGHSDYLHCIVARNSVNQVESFFLFLDYDHSPSLVNLSSTMEIGMKAPFIML